MNGILIHVIERSDCDTQSWKRTGTLSEHIRPILLHEGSDRVGQTVWHCLWFESPQYGYPYR